MRVLPQALSCLASPIHQPPLSASRATYHKTSPYQSERGLRRNGCHHHLPPSCMLGERRTALVNSQSSPTQPMRRRRRGIGGRVLVFVVHAVCLGWLVPSTVNTVAVAVRPNCHGRPSRGFALGRTTSRLACCVFDSMFSCISGKGDGDGKSSLLSDTRKPVPSSRPLQRAIVILGSTAHTKKRLPTYGVSTTTDGASRSW